MILAIAQGKVPACPKGGKNYINTKDVAVAIANALSMGRIGECYLLGNENLTFKEAFVRIANELGAKAPANTIPDFMVKFYGGLMGTLAKIFRFEPTVSYRASRVSCDQHYYTSQKAIEELQLPQTPIEEGVRDFYNWYLLQKALTEINGAS